MSSNYDTWLEDRADWCALHNRTTNDIMKSPKGEYVLVEADLMDDGDEVDAGKLIRVYLPDVLQKGYAHDEKQD